MTCSARTHSCAQVVREHIHFLLRFPMLTLLVNSQRFITRNQFAPISDVGSTSYFASKHNTVSKSALAFQRRRMNDEAHKVLLIPSSIPLLRICLSCPKIEANSLSNLHHLLRHSIEALSFLRILQDYDLPRIIAGILFSSSFFHPLCVP